MRVLINRRRHRQLVDSSVWWLLIGFDRPVIDAALAAYPGRLTAADQGLASGEAVEQTAVKIAATILAGVIETRLAAERREAIYEQILIRAQTPETAELSSDPAVNAWVKGILTAENQAFMWTQGRQLDPAWRDVLMSEILGALRGYSAQERSNRRLIGALDRGMRGELA